MNKEFLIDALVKKDNSRARSKQIAVGVSQLGGCSRQVWHTLKGDAKTNPTSRLAAIMGTAIHAAIEEALAKDKSVMIEHRIEADGDLPPATIDCYIPETGEVIDWKTIKLSGVNYFVTRQKRWQIQTYGYLLARQGFDVKTVTLVGIPRDGDEGDILIHSEPYDEATALEALAWLENIKLAEAAPAPEKDATFCKKYCGFYGDLCSGLSKDITGEPIVDPEVTSAATRYREILDAEKALALEKDSVKSALVGVSGITFEGIKVSWSEVAGRATPDLDAIKLLLDEVPMKQGAPSLRLSVK